MIGRLIPCAGLVLAFAFMLAGCGGRAAPTSTLTPQPAVPLRVAPAVADGAVGLLETGAESDVVSPAGIDAALCALVPENGIRVRATTMFDIPLGAPHSKRRLTFDRPFAMRVVDAGGVTVAVAIVNDLPGR